MMLLTSINLAYYQELMAGLRVRDRGRAVLGLHGPR